MSSRHRRLGLLAQHLALGVKLGVLIGMVTGFLETTAHWLSGSPVITRQFLFPAMLAYGLMWSVGGLGLGLLRGAWRGGQSIEASDTAWYLAALMASALVVVVGGYVNLYWLPSFTSPSSLLFDGIFILSVLVLARVIAYPLLRQMLTWTGQTQVRVWIRPRRVALAMLVCVLVLTYFPSLRAQGLPSKAGGQVPCNVVLIVMDAVRADHLSTHGYSGATQPNLDRLAARGVRFANAMANASWTHPSIPTLLTSLYPSTHQVNLIASGLDPSVLTLPELLKQAGMATAVFSGNTFVSPLFGFGQGVDLFVHGRANMMEELIVGHGVRKLTLAHPRPRAVVKNALRWFDRLNPRAATASEGTSATELTQAFLAWVKKTAPQRFFAYLHYMEPHTPYDPPDFPTQLLGSNPAARDNRKAPPIIGILPFHRGKSLSADARQRLIELYDGEIRRVDAALGALAEGLEQLGVAQDTVIIVTADHGEEFFDHGGWQHGHSLYQELLHVPLIVSYPARLPMDRVVETRVSHVDVMPTILELCGLNLSLPMEGRSLLPFLEGQDGPSADRAMYSELYRGGASARALIRGRYKVIASEDGAERQVALYDLHDDPAETRDLSAQMPSVVSSLIRELDQMTQAAVARRASGPVTARLDGETRRHLKALGYLQ